MEQVSIKRHNDNDWSRQMMDESHYDSLFDRDVFVRKESGDPLLVLLKGAIPEKIMAQTWAILRNYRPATRNRGTASGIKSTKKRADGTYGNYSNSPPGWQVGSGAVGFFERDNRRPFAHALAWNEKNPEKSAKLIPLCELVSDIYHRRIPDRWQQQKDICKRTSPQYLIGQSIFTTLTINKNFRTSAHLDAGDLPQGFSCMAVIREGLWKGAHLVLPSYRVAAQLDHGDLILFDPHEFHGNTQLIRLGKNSQRCSIVFYYREKLQFCKSPAEEIAFAKSRKPGEPLWP